MFQVYIRSEPMIYTELARWLLTGREGKKNGIHGQKLVGRMRHVHSSYMPVPRGGVSIGGGGEPAGGKVAHKLNRGTCELLEVLVILSPDRSMRWRKLIGRCTKPPFGDSGVSTCG